MSDVDARYLGLTANQLALIATDLKAENAKLLNGAAKMARWYDEELKAVLDENAKLRELCGFMLRCMLQYHGHCDYCLVNGEHCDITYIESDAKELGIEVDGC